MSRDGYRLEFSNRDAARRDFIGEAMPRSRLQVY